MLLATPPPHLSCFLHLAGEPGCCWRFQAWMQNKTRWGLISPRLSAYVQAASNGASFPAQKTQGASPGHGVTERPESPARVPFSFPYACVSRAGGTNPPRCHRCCRRVLSMRWTCRDVSSCRVLSPSTARLRASRCFSGGRRKTSSESSRKVMARATFNLPGAAECSPSWEATADENSRPCSVPQQRAVCPQKQGTAFCL